MEREQSPPPVEDALYEDMPGAGPTSTGDGQTALAVYDYQASKLMVYDDSTQCTVPETAMLIFTIESHQNYIFTETAKFTI